MTSETYTGLAGPQRTEICTSGGLMDACRQASGLPSVGELSKTGLPDRSEQLRSLARWLADVLQMIEAAFVDIKNFLRFRFVEFRRE